MKRFAIIYLSTLIILLPLDILFLGIVGKKLFADNVGDMILATPRMAPAIVFYVLYLAGVVVFVNGDAPSNWAHSLSYGALFGLFCYATFELTNMSVLKHWEWAVVVPDIAWGAVLTAVAAAIGGLLADWILHDYGQFWSARGVIHMSGPWTLSTIEAAIFLGLVLALAGAATLATAGVQASVRNSPSRCALHAGLYAALRRTTLRTSLRGSTLETTLRRPALNLSECLGRQCQHCGREDDA